MIALRPEPEVEKALRTPAREQIQQEADRSTYERRAVAVERERAIAENELQSQIELARREEQLRRPSSGANARRQARGRRGRERGSRSQAQADKERAARARRAPTGPGRWARPRRPARPRRVAAYRDLPPSTLLALAAKDLAGGLPQIGTLVLAPDLLTSLLSRLASGDPAVGDGCTAAQEPAVTPRAPGGAGAPAHRTGASWWPGTGPAGRPRSTCGPAGRRIEDLEARHDAVQAAALAAVSSAIPADWRRGLVERADLPRFLFGPDDIVVAVGQDGLVANLAKYLDGQLDHRHRPRAGAQPRRPGPAPARARAPGCSRSPSAGAAASRAMAGRPPPRRSSD